MAKKSATPRAAAKPRSRPAVSAEWTPAQRQQIAERAYQLFLERGGQHGYHHEDWLQAEAEFGTSLRAAKKSRRASAAS